MIGVQFSSMFLQNFIDIGNDILDIMVARHRPTIWLVFIGIRLPELVDIGSKVDIWRTIIFFNFLSSLRV